GIHRTDVAVEGMQRIAGRIELLRRQVLVVGQQPALAVVHTTEHRLVPGHGPCRRSVVADDVQHQLHVARMQRARQVGKVHARTGQVLVHAMEVHAPVAVVTGLATVAEEAVAAGGRAAGEGLVRVVDDGRDPDRAKAHVLDVVEVVGQPPEVAAQVADVAAHAIAWWQWNVEAAVGTALVAMIVARVAVDEPVGDHEVHGMAGEGLERAVEFVEGSGSRCRGIRPHVATRGGEAGAGQDNKDWQAHAQASPVALRGRACESGRRTRSVHSPAMNRQPPPSTSTRRGSPSSSFDSTTPSVLTATSCGITMKKLKMPMYTPIFAAGRLSDSI